MKVLNRIIATLTVVFLVGSFWPLNGQEEKPLLVQIAPIGGKLDLTNWNFQESGSVSLKGEWEFYWRRLISPDSFKRGEIKPL